MTVALLTAGVSAGAVLGFIVVAAAMGGAAYLVYRRARKDGESGMPFDL